MKKISIPQKYITSFTLNHGLVQTGFQATQARIITFLPENRQNGSLVQFKVSLQSWQNYLLLTWTRETNRWVFFSNISSASVVVPHLLNGPFEIPEQLALEKNSVIWEMLQLPEVSFYQSVSFEHLAVWQECSLNLWYSYFRKEKSYLKLPGRPLNVSDGTYFCYIYFSKMFRVKFIPPM